MITRVLNYRFTQLSLSLLIILGMLICIFTPNYFLFKMGVEFAFQIMLGYLSLGFIFLFIKQPRLMFTSFACCAGLCLYLKYSTNSAIIHPAKTGEIVLDIAHFDVSASNEDHEATINRILAVNADLISIQEVNLSWADSLEKRLAFEYPFHETIERTDFGLAIYSKLPLTEIETFTYEGRPNIMGTVRLEEPNEKVCFITSHSLPSFYSRDFEQRRKHLMTIADHYDKKIKHYEETNQPPPPLITIGNYDVVPWSYEIQDFRAAARLYDSRRGFMPASNGKLSFQTPTDYIFHSDDFQCLGFDEISSPYSNHIGIRGSYQLDGKAEL